MSQLKDKGFISEDEGRQQMIADGLFTISMPEHAPGKPVDAEQPDAEQTTPDRPMMVGSPVNPSAGGYGEIRNTLSAKAVERMVSGVSAALKPAIDVYRGLPEDDWYKARQAFPELLDDVLNMLSVPKGVDDITAELVQRFVANEIGLACLNDSLDAYATADYDGIVSRIQEKARSLFVNQKESK
jgi:hypothetical protein